MSNPKRERMYNIQCECVQCGVTFLSSRYDAIFHSADCRQKHYRAKQSRYRLMSQINDNIVEMLSKATTPEAYESVLDEVERTIAKARIAVIG